MKISYRELQENDILSQKKEIIALFKLLFAADDCKEIIATKYFENMYEFSKDGSAILLGAFYGDNLIGFHWGYEISWGGHKRIHSYFIAVEENYQNMSVGTTLQKMLEDVAVSKGIGIIDTNCEADNQKSFKYHLKQGFEIEGYHMKKVLKI